MTSITETRAWRFALVGTPNSGKTALFNALTGSRQKVANYPGVTVERKTGVFHTSSGYRIDLVDLPGTYSLRGRSPDEEVTRDMVLGRVASETPPDLLLCVADATNLRVALRLVTELKRAGRPMLLILNMIDIARRRGIDIDIPKLEAELGLPVVTSTAVRRGGTEDLLRRLDDLAANGAGETHESEWQTPSVADLRAAQREADRVIKAAVSEPARPDTLTARVDAVLLHPVAGILILLALLFVMFQAVFAWAQPFMELISAGFTALGVLAHDMLPEGLLQSFIQNGVIAGVGSVLVFLPQIMILFLFILLLEDLGYMARAAFLMDRIMGGAGLHGRAFIPLLSSFACAIPGIMATRVIDNRRDRLTTIMVAPLMTCSARIPVYTLIIAAFVPDRTVGGIFGLQGLVMFGLYAIGIASALAVSFVANHFFWRESATPPFMLELPDYKLPQLRSVAMALYARVMAFLQRAGTTIFAMMVVIWFLASFPRPPEGATEAGINYSLAAMLGRWIEPVLAPIGFNWQISVALIPGMAAREVAVASLGTMYAIGGGDEASAQIGQALASQWSLATALAFLAWYIFAPQCASTLAVIRRETGGWRWMFITFFYMLALAYLAAFVTFRIASALGWG
ncbi:ferrous iron transport protein B [Afipia carboxidovorans OM5]|uniref:Fe(2+) transporter FeoB n=1 Tax=Afipia carboxidovorans (strain ATCC 49405 / DSM 1227 / KCTC 32145 / OM5) TaxID=504832 RepID=B6JD46_AFIC5|nr:ferrous iron transporter B [Afipia carboxidovorans]ACI91776.1 ferrous iron transport protein B [Afipia carboxidovorans OM5]AEI04358.1 ferrous iron transport protein B [Afipia carboxidovorans OM4]AEI07988.1 ferrous iron transport protein B [Afipia carboxidovorans OM5]BEV45418.1 ferrous iron transporter B [Afipia carboxidovorans]